MAVTRTGCVSASVVVNSLAMCTALLPRVAHSGQSPRGGRSRQNTPCLSSSDEQSTRNLRSSRDEGRQNPKMSMSRGFILMHAEASAVVVHALEHVRVLPEGSPCEPIAALVGRDHDRPNVLCRIDVVIAEWSANVAVCVGVVRGIFIPDGDILSVLKLLDDHVRVDGQAAALHWASGGDQTSPF